ncbi:hypothetical protein TEA_018931 [Camellia sinensis var. sinensis]|uniref:Wall-associated receptor kinase galacturonan-binding domain-containing protein n=1 Tax=Camellia sinensis var. sinensis TaxID=542762 RepID=A0A4S4EJE0_CAMSN|nr:hypothetical protein TEA_018931 [Camellia sinensis var. sinensis]
MAEERREEKRKTRAREGGQLTWDLSTPLISFTLLLVIDADKAGGLLQSLKLRLWQKRGGRRREEQEQEPKQEREEFQCANFPNISYPFWGGNRPDYCGHPNFGLDCQGDALRITIQSAYRVLAIDTTTRTLTVVREEFWNNTCPTQFQNTTLDTAHFTYLSDSQNLTLLLWLPENFG